MRKTVYFDSRKARMKPDGDTLRVSRSRQSDFLIPLSRVERAVITHENADLLQACLAIVQRGGTVHFQDGAGNLCGILKQPRAEGSPWARDLAATIEHSSNHLAYQHWLDTQRRHGWSLVFRNNYRGDFEANRRSLVKYLLYFCPSLDIDDELGWLNQQLRGWLQAQLEYDGLQPVMRLLAARDIQLDHDLMPCLFIPLLWQYITWRRHRQNSLVHERVEFFELQARTRLLNQLQRHLQALESAYHGLSITQDSPFMTNTYAAHLP